jgi:predicted site-specific integrase-resolvase
MEVMHRQSPNGHELLTSSPAARLAGVSDSTIRNWAERGWLPTLHTATGIRLFRRRDVLRAAAKYGPASA